jgi:hypothetical protein
MNSSNAVKHLAAALDELMALHPSMAFIAATVSAIFWFLAA